MNRTWGFGRCFLYLRNVKGDFNREALGIEVDFSLAAERVVRTLEQIVDWSGKPASIRCDNEPEYLRVDQHQADQISLYPARTAATKCVYRTVQQEMARAVRAWDDLNRSHAMDVALQSPTPT